MSDAHGAGDAPHLSLATAARDSPAPPLAPEFARQGKLWRPRRVLITPNAWALPHGRSMVERAASYGAEVLRLSTNRLPPITANTEAETVRPGQNDLRHRCLAARPTQASADSPFG